MSYVDLEVVYDDIPFTVHISVIDGGFDYEYQGQKGFHREVDVECEAIYLEGYEVSDLLESKVIEKLTEKAYDNLKDGHY